MTFLSDFRNNSNYVSQMKGVALSMTDAKLIDITHEISPHNIKEAAFILKTTIPYFPEGTVHVAVVDPGVGTSRKGIVVTARTQILVGPDNGLLIPAAKSLGNFTVYEITNRELMLNSISNTFHGRDVFTPVASHILNGVLFEEIGHVINNYINLDFGEFEIKDNKITAKIIYVDSFGNIITNIDALKLSQVLEYNKKIKLFIGRRRIDIPFVRAYNYVKPGELLTTIGSSNLLEISINQGNAFKKLGLKTDSEISLILD